MLTYSQIRRLASKQLVPEEIIEKDYLIELVLFYLAKDAYFKERFVFRGGTALKKVYFPDYRFSEDLDLYKLLKGLKQIIEGTYTVIRDRRYRDRIKEAFGIDPLKCKRCGREMELEEIYHPKYGVIYDGWKELVQDEPGTGYAVWRPIKEVSLQMQFVWA